MIKPIYEITLYLSCIIEVSGVYQVISSSFQGNSFNDADNWVVSGAQPQFADCMGHLLFGGYNAFGGNVGVSKIFKLPPHTSINLKVQFWKMEEGFIFMDYQMAWQMKYNYDDGTQMCGSGGQWKDVSVNLNLNIKHNGPTAIVVFTTDLDEGRVNESWGFRDFVLSVNNCPEGCLVCQEADTILECYVWKVIQTSWNQLDVNEIVTDGWNAISRISEVTQCGSVPLFGGFKKTGTQTIISKSFFNIPPHYKLKIQFLWAKIDLWDNEAAQLRVDSVVVWEKNFEWYQGYFSKICGNSDVNRKTIFIRTELDIQHTISQVETKFSTAPDEPTDRESFGLRDFIIFYGSCTDNCAQCTGPSGSECLMCAKGCFNTGVDDKICQLCYLSCYQCDGPKIEDCTDCGDPNIYLNQW